MRTLQLESEGEQRHIRGERSCVIPQELLSLQEGYEWSAWHGDVTSDELKGIILRAYNNLLGSVGVDFSMLGITVPAFCRKDVTAWVPILQSASCKILPTNKELRKRKRAVPYTFDLQRSFWFPYTYQVFGFVFLFPASHSPVPVLLFLCLFFVPYIFTFASVHL